jgi:starch synthase
MKIMFVGSEAVPFAKTGGLGDVIGALPKPLQALGCDIRVILPKYQDIPEAYKKEMQKHITAEWTMQLGWRQQYCGIQQLDMDGITYYFVDNEYYFKRGGLYGYGDEVERYAFFSRAVLEALPLMGWKPDVIHCHDWQSGLIPYMLKTKYAHNPFYSSIRSVFTIHNLMYQGILSVDLLRDLVGISIGDSSIRELELHGGSSCLKGGIAFADRVTTVSKTYAEEIQTGEYGENLDGLLRWRREDLVGIVNGIDNTLFDPMNDPAIAIPFRNSLEKKRANKLALQRELALPESAEIPMIAIVTRLVEQKGLDLIASVLDELLQENIQLVVLGTGEKQYEHLFGHAEFLNREKVRACLRFDDRLARRMYASSDFFLMPSRFEPCGIGQLLAMRYRSIPIVRETGGLKDTVQPYNEFTGEGWGFSFTNYNASDMLHTIRRSLLFYHQEEQWERLHHNVRKLDFGWERSAKAYLSLYQEIADHS